jgi:hypothetical protein
MPTRLPSPEKLDLAGRARLEHFLFFGFGLTFFHLKERAASFSDPHSMRI